ncbi:MAG: electron transfer flavoprotein subunit beta/FixA family protein [Desulfobacterales bacterium]|nr:electron transfer flavoprotein subunit beta/FixA family protein [Desulfobacterales bacterium]
MKILVCIKQVPDPESAFAVDPEAPRLDANTIGDLQMNRFDAYALEAALRLRESGIEIRIDAVTVGPKRCGDVLKRAVGMGADRAFHLLDEFEANADDPQWIAWAIASWARQEAYDLVLAGVISEDRMQGVTGPALAALLDLPCATAVAAFQLSTEKKIVRAEREIEEGNRDIVELDLPAVLTIQSGIHTPRYPSLSNLLRAGRQPPQCIQTAPQVMPQPKQSVVLMNHPQRTRHGRKLGGSPEQKAAELLALFRARGLLKDGAP